MQEAVDILKQINRPSDIFNKRQGLKLKSKGGRRHFTLCPVFTRE
jgi:hypothetical protein